MDLISIIESVKLPEIDEDPQEEENWTDFINIFLFLQASNISRAPELFYHLVEKKKSEEYF